MLRATPVLWVHASNGPYPFRLDVFGYHATANPATASPVRLALARRTTAKGGKR